MKSFLSRFFEILSKSNFLSTILILILVVTIYTFSGTSHSLIAPDEIRYVGIAGVMHAKDNWIDSEINNIPFFHKPSLFYWLTMIGIDIFGKNLIAWRFSSIISSIIIIFAWRYFLRRNVNPTLAGASTLILALSLPIWLAGQYANLDQLVASMITCTILFGIEAGAKLKRGLPANWSLFLTYLFAALGMLSKGLIGVVLPGAVIVAWLILTGKVTVIFKYFKVSFILMFTLIGIGPLVLINLKYPDYLYYFFYVQQVSRFLSPGTFNNIQPIWFYIPLILLTLGQWMILIPLNRVSKIKRLFTSKSETSKSETSITSNIDVNSVDTNSVETSLSDNYEFTQVKAQPQVDKEISLNAKGIISSLELLVLCAVWAIIITVFFSIPKSKLVGYILPAVSPTIMLVVAWVYRNYQKANVSFANFIGNSKSGYSGLLTFMSFLLIVIYVGVTFTQDKFVKTSYNLTNSQNQVFSLPSDKQNVEIYSFGRFPYSFQMFYNYYRPLHVVLDLQDPDLRVTDNWRKELIEGMDYFKPQIEKKAFTDNQDFVQQLCSPDSELINSVKNKYVYVIVYYKELNQNNYPPIIQKLISLPAEYTNNYYNLFRLTPEIVESLAGSCPAITSINSTIEQLKKEAQDVNQPIQTPEHPVNSEQYDQ